MKHESNHSHFEGKTALEHLKTARKKGRLITEAVHGLEPSGARIAGYDAARELVLAFSIFYIVISPFIKIECHVLIALGLFSLAFILWKTCRSALLGWARLARVHKLIQEEKWEIEHHRAQEKEELLELYEAKGFKDKQLQEVVEVLMADDNRLLQIMLEEELGLSLGSFEHPLRQCLGAFIGSLIGAVLSIVAVYIAGFLGVILGVSISFCLTGFLLAKELGNDRVKGVIWNLSSGFLTIAMVYFLMKSLTP